MEIVVHGTKGGYRIFYKTPGAPSIGSDIRNNVSSEAAIGRSAYSISFAANGYAFTKYIIIRDTLRSDATGFIAFSLFLLFSEDLPNKGYDIQLILDELSNYYVREYVRNNSINKGESIIIQEDWSFVNNILLRNVALDKKQRNIDIQAGTKEAAYIFYKDDAKLQNYFSYPFQEEYNGFKQILFINEDLRNSSVGLLNVLRNSGLELQVDLTNEHYFLSSFESGRGLTIRANGRKVTGERNNNVIRAKEKIEISYTKKYYKPIEVTGTISNPNSGIYKYIEIRGTQINIKYDAFSLEQIPFERKITFDIKRADGTVVNNVEINCKCENNSKIILNNLITFSGKEIGQRWTISAKKTDSLFLDDKIIIPENESHLELVLNERKVIKFRGELKTEQGSNYFPDIKINITKKRIRNSSITEVEFINDEIYNQFEVVAEYKENNNYLSGQVLFSPKDVEEGIPVLIEMKRIKSTLSNPIYKIDPGKHGSSHIGYSYSVKGEDITIKVKTKGYIFNGFKLKETNKMGNYDGTLVAQYERTSPFFRNSMVKNGLILLVILLILFSLIMIVFKNNENSVESQLPSKQHIKNYIEGNSLILDTLNSYKSMPDIEQMKILESLDSAIKKRKLINAWSIDELKTMHYSISQKHFDTTIDKLQISQYNIIKSKFRDVSTWNLNDIADSINSALNSTEHTEVIPSDKDKEGKENIKREATRSIDSNKTHKKVNNTVNQIDKTVEIIHYLIGNELKKDELNKYLLEARSNGTLKNSIKLCLKFWDLDGTKNRSYSSFLKELRGDPNMQKSELIFFVEEMARKDKPQYPKEVQGVVAGITNTLQKLNNKILK